MILQALRTLYFNMITKTIKYRVLYADTDKAGIVYYGTYARFYEMGRTELVRSLGYAYKQLEDMGVIMPVVSVNAKYLKSLYYDDEITIETTVPKIPEARAIFITNIYNSAGELVNTAEVTLVFLDMKTKRLTRAPKELTDVLIKQSK